MSKPYRPSNGEEGEWFMERFCYRCAQDGGDEMKCPIIAASMCFNSDDAEYPKELIYNDQGRPTCTAFRTEPEPPAKPRDIHGQTFMFLEEEKS